MLREWRFWLGIETHIAVIWQVEFPLKEQSQVTELSMPFIMIGRLQLPFPLQGSMLKSQSVFPNPLPISFNTLTAKMGQNQTKSSHYSENHKTKSRNSTLHALRDVELCFNYKRNSAQIRIWHVGYFIQLPSRVSSLAAVAAKAELMNTKNWKPQMKK